MSQSRNSEEYCFSSQHDSPEDNNILNPELTPAPLTQFSNESKSPEKFMTQRDFPILSDSQRRLSFNIQNIPHYSLLNNFDNDRITTEQSSTGLSSVDSNKTINANREAFQPHFLNTNKLNPLENQQSQLHQDSSQNHQGQTADKKSRAKNQPRKRNGRFARKPKPSKKAKSTSTAIVSVLSAPVAAAASSSSSPIAPIISTSSTPVANLQNMAAIAPAVFSSPSSLFSPSGSANVSNVKQLVEIEHRRSKKMKKYDHLTKTFSFK